MFLGKKDQLVGLDIGSSQIKVAVLKSTSKGLVLQKLGMTSVPPGLIDEGRIMDADAVADIIRTLFKTHGIKQKNVAISTGGYSVVIKTIVLPTVSEKELVKSIRTEAEQYIPYDIDDVNLDFQILGPSEFSDDQMNVLLVAVKKDLVAEYIDLINQAGLNPCIIDVDSFALQNIYEAIYKPAEDKMSLLVDVGCSKTSLNILSGTNSLMMRDSASGTAQIRESIMAEIDCSPDRADDILVGTSESEIPRARLEEICFDFIQTWCSDIEAVVKGHLNKTNDTSLDKVIISGGGVLMDGFADLLAVELSTEVSIIDPFQGILVDPKKFPPSFLHGVRAQAPIAMGLSLRKMDDK
ncbi:type IV pilus assembly protein PilM [Desulfocicer vacuolatum DSM 3385]|uniref:Type IV pilus assembly protein PilM n=1 Tax=Desulfocicer vacuolatum DSM 3385 TaxID=1121400 RepID=A0A1W1ZVD7_9BACT|nr:type IV pilus assembly protein PilM [Desulfocicer vacuolatum]SMC52018.1 type IV pilus assembly protein PilM [Desulfocicer vacuolatum DSM 3385]